MAKNSAATPYPYEIEYKGKTIRCRTLDEMEQALGRLEGSKLAREVTPWGVDEFQRFTGRIHVPPTAPAGEVARIRNYRMA